MSLTIEKITAMSQEEKDEALFIAARDGHAEDIAILMIYKSDPLKRFIYNRTSYLNALDIAIIKGELTAVQALLKHKIVLKYATENINTLERAVYHGHSAVMHELLKIDLIKNQAASDENIVLYRAASKGDLAIVQDLLNVDVIYQAAAANQNSALNVAASNGHQAVVEALLKIDAVRQSADALSNNALNSAVEGRHFTIVSILLAVEKVKNELTFIMKHNLECEGYYTWERRCILLAIRGMRNQGLTFESMLPILQSLYPDYSENILCKQVMFVKNLPSNFSEFMHQLALTRNYERLNHLIREGYENELADTTANLLKSKGYIISEDKPTRLIFSYAAKQNYERNNRSVNNSSIQSKIEQGISDLQSNCLMM